MPKFVAAPSHVHFRREILGPTPADRCRGTGTKAPAGRDRRATPARGGHPVGLTDSADPVARAAPAAIGTGASARGQAGGGRVGRVPGRFGHGARGEFGHAQPGRFGHAEHGRAGGIGAVDHPTSSEGTPTRGVAMSSHGSVHGPARSRPRPVVGPGGRLRRAARSLPGDAACGGRLVTRLIRSGADTRWIDHVRAGRSHGGQPLVPAESGAACPARARCAQPAGPGRSASRTFGARRGDRAVAAGAWRNGVDRFRGRRGTRAGARVAPTPFRPPAPRPPDEMPASGPGRPGLTATSGEARIPHRRSRNGGADDDPESGRHARPAVAPVARCAWWWTGHRRRAEEPGSGQRRQTPSPWRAMPRSETRDAAPRARNAGAGGGAPSVGAEPVADARVPMSDAVSCTGRRRTWRVPPGHTRR